METVICYKTNGKIFETSEEAAKYEKECNFKNELYKWSARYDDYYLADRVFDDWKDIYEIIKKYKKIGEEE